VATYAASRHRQIVPCCMISHASHASVWCLVGDSSMCWDTALDKAFENVFCILAILRFQTKNRFCESSQRLIQPRLVRCSRSESNKPNRINGADTPENWHPPLEVVSEKGEMAE